ncbi:class I SAM-dependent methyltransferase [Cellulomonas fimi]|uniref:class I SAM-dependent methyltransferase n=1 Tax=Cellulomonas fimi TaxID=1708 RepID=UPI00059F47DA|nr:class I SAM-dependent methyltransferase [Cellulomonas fimi]NNH06538.1 class I SAM-dependent methyltransferase [Cellulomonas fimi]
MPDPGHFDALADVYDRARPPYPAALWDRLRTLGVLRPGARVVELGAGSGLATGPLVRAGATVTAVEPGPALARLLRARWPDVTVHEATAERVALPHASFDLAVAATSVHWLDLDVVLPKLHRALVPGGALAVWRHVFGDPQAPVTPFRQRVADVVARRGAVPARPGPGELDTTAWSARLAAGGWFRVVDVAHLRWTVVLDAEQVRDLFLTFSDWRPDEADAVAHAVRDLGGRVTEHYVTPLVVLARAATPVR